MMGLVVTSAIADQGGPQDYGKELLLTSPALVDSITAVNKGSSTVYIQFLDTPRKSARAISNTNKTTGVITFSAVHEYQTGDKVTFSGITGLTTHYINAATTLTVKCYSTRALALAGGTPDVLPTNDNETGSMTLASDAASAPAVEEYPVLAAGSAPSNVLSVSNLRFKRGMWVRAVTAQNGSTLISTDDIKYTPRYRGGDVLENEAYRD